MFGLEKKFSTFCVLIQKENSAVLLNPLLSTSYLLPAPSYYDVHHAGVLPHLNPFPSSNMRQALALKAFFRILYSKSDLQSCFIFLEATGTTSLHVFLRCSTILSQNKFSHIDMMIYKEKENKIAKVLPGVLHSVLNIR